MSRQIRVYLTPLINYSIYGDEIEVTDYVSSIGRLKRQIERDDGEIGKFDYDNVAVKFYNRDGRFTFSDFFSDGRSFFKFRRDKAKLRITYDFNGVETELFKGLLLEDDNKADLKQETISLQFRSIVSELSYLDVIGGLISPRDTVSRVVKKVLNQPALRQVITYNEDNINIPSKVDLVLDDAGVLDDETCKQCLDLLLLATNTVLYVTNDNNVIVNTREQEKPNSRSFNQDNIINIKDIKDGFNKLFNKVSIGEGDSKVVARNNTSINFYNKTRPKNLDNIITFFTDVEKREILAQNIVDSFSEIKQELTVVTTIDNALNIDLLDTVSLQYEGNIKPTGEITPQIDITELDQENAPLPYELIPLIIEKTDYRVIGINYNLSNYTVDVTMRLK